MPTSLSIGRARTKVHAMNAIGRHNGRQEEEEERERLGLEPRTYGNDDIDLDRTPGNITLYRYPHGKTYKQSWDDIIEKYDNTSRKIRDDACGMVATSVNFGGLLKEASHDEKVRVLTGAYEILNEMYPYVLGANIHTDESEYHLHFDFVPIVATEGKCNGLPRLCANDVFGGKLQMHEFQEHMLKSMQERFPEYDFQRLTEEQRVANGRSLKELKSVTKMKKEAEAMKVEAEEALAEAGETVKETAMTLSQTLAGRTVELDKRERNLKDREKGLRDRETKVERSETSVRSFAETNLRDAQTLKDRADALDLSESEFEQEKKTWKTRTDAYRDTLDTRDEAQKVKEAELNKRGQEFDNRAQTLSDLENRLKMDEKAISDGFENLESEKADFEAYMAEMQEELRNEREELDKARELLETKTEDLKELKGSLFTKAKHMNDTARATENRITGLISMGQVREAQREADEFEAWNDAAIEQMFNDLEEASDFAL